jgi:hypothetical protein
MKTIELPYSEITNIPKIVCHDKGNKSKSKITFINSDKNWYFKTIVDGGVLDNTNGKKCDFKIEKYTGSETNAECIKAECEKNPCNGVQYFVELKGENINDAVPQLENAIKKLHNGVGGCLAFIIFSNKSPNSATANMQIVKSFKKRNKINLIIQKTPYEYKL